MPEFDRFSGCIEWIDLSFVERQRTPEWAIQVDIRCHLAGMSTKNASQFLDELGVQRSHVAIYNWVHEADLQLVSTVSADQLAVDEKMIRINGNDYWLYGAIDRNKRNLAVQAVLNDDETDDAVVSRQAPSTIST